MNVARVLVLLAFFATFTQNVFAQFDLHFLELNDYQFFGSGKLKALKLGVSTKNDVAKIFGNICEEFCDYDSEWKVDFWYFDEKAYIQTYSQKADGQKFDEKFFVPKPEFIGTIRAVKLTPKKQISFSQIVFPEEFERDTSTRGGLRPSGESVSITFATFQNKTGLKYEIFDDDEHRSIEFANEKRSKGDLISIEYAIPDELEKEMFVLKKQ